MDIETQLKSLFQWPCQRLGVYKPADRHYMLLYATCSLCRPVCAGRHSYSAHILSVKRHRYLKKEKEDLYGSNG